ncbi:MAG: hydroxyphenylacetyl-CoA thioesterase PaaI [Candidatus Bathyarchaeota archaeon]|nr:hydroxyphenylacetyl-CoA thioesterase PaaI [Candidatus Bathyarchaeota archaeon]
MKGTDSYAEALGIKVLESKDGYCKTAMTVGKKHTNAHGFTHGGAIFSLADYAFAHACNFGDNVAVALQVSINYLKPTVEGDVLTAEATRVSDGKTTGLYNVMVRKDEKLVAVFSGLAFKK